MAYTAPTPADLKARYPAFTAVADSAVQIWIDDAMLTVTTGWLEDDYRPAIMSMAAHNMAGEGLGASSAIGNLKGVTSFKSGTFSASFSEEAANQAAKGGYQSTRYGQAFVVYLRRNRGGPRVAGLAFGCCARTW